ncbi:Hypothetical_protein [Hexamita inflata]|uniref:Hypothetical_protein n=1 Tax=Hexamita inflata TaxID=28002 RepID=A0AA86PHW4_9EUKA|nr:Hypothetical protein HINF_LOCUS23827 [Hexamita inflata]
MINKKTTAFLSNQISRVALSHVKPPHRLSVSFFGLMEFVLVGTQFHQVPNFITRYLISQIVVNIIKYLCQHNSKKTKSLQRAYAEAQSENDKKQTQSSAKITQKETQAKKEDKQPVLENSVKSQSQDGQNELETITDEKQEKSQYQRKTRIRSSKQNIVPQKQQNQERYQRN